LINASQVGFRSRGFYTAVSILGWRAFWKYADENQDNWGAVLLAWTAGGLSIGVVLYQ
jgi:hypothetical protein